MKKIKQANGYTIYVTTERDVRNGDAPAAGEYAIYISADIREYGREYCYPEWDGIDSLEVALELCTGSNYARAKAIAEAHNDSTVECSFEEIEAVEAALESGASEELIHEAIEALQDDGFGIEDVDRVLVDDGIDTYIVVAGREDANGDPYLRRQTFTGVWRIESACHTAAKTDAFSDLTGEHTLWVMAKGRLLRDAGWQPGMRIIYSDAETGEIVYDQTHPERDH